MLLLNPDFSRLTSAHVVPSYACARACHYCYNTHLNQDDTPDAAKLCSTLAALLARVRQPIEIEVIGGEPLEGFARETTRRVIELAHTHSMCRHLSLNTAICAPEAVRACLPRLDTLFLSIDPSRSLLNRKRLNVTRLQGIVSACRDADVALHVSSVLFGREDEQVLRGFIDQLIQCGVDRVGFSHDVCRGLGATEIQEYARQYYALFRLRLSLDDHIQIGGLVLDDIDLAVRGRSRRSGCGCGVSSVLVEPDGAVSAGTFFDHRDRSVYGAAEFDDLRGRRLRSLESSRPCMDCDLWGPCGGGCLGVAAYESGDPMNREESLCKILLSLWAHVKSDLRR